MNQISFSAKTLELLERMIETSSQLKGQIEMSLRDQQRNHQATEKSITDHEIESNKSHEEIQENIRKLLADCRDMTLKLELSPFSKIADQQQESDKYFMKAFQEALQKVEHIVSWVDNKGVEALETAKKIEKWTEDNKAASAASVKGKWGIYAVLVAQFGTIIVLLITKFL